MFIIYSIILFHLMTVAGFFQIIGLLFIVAGAIFSFYGWKFRSLLVAVTGFIVGGGIGTLIDTMFNTSYFGYGSIVLAIFSAFLGVVVFLTLEKIAVGVSIGSIGALLLWTATGSQVAGIIGFIIAAYLGWKFYKFSNIFIFLTAGAILCSGGGLIAGFWSFEFSWVIALCIIIMGLIIQYGRKTPSSEPEKP